MTNKPITIRGSGDATIIDLGANAISAFDVPFAQAYAFENLQITGSVANLDRRIVSISAAARVSLNRITASNIRRAIEVTGGVGPVINIDTCIWVLLNDPASFFIGASAFTTVHAQNVSCVGASGAGGIAGSPVVEFVDLLFTTVNTTAVGSNSNFTGCSVIGVAGETVTLGTRSKVVGTSFSSVTVVASGSKVEFSSSDFIGSAGQARVLDVTGAEGPNVTGCTFSGCNSELVRINGGSLDSVFSGNDFIDDATASRAIDVLAGAFRALIDGNAFRFFDTEAVRIASANCIVTSNTGCKVVETGTANVNVYANNTGFDPSTIIGAASRIEDNNVVTTGLDTTLTEFYRTVEVDASGANRTITLPTAVSARFRKYTIKKIDATANTVTVDADGAETIDGALTVVLTTQWQSVTVQSNGVSWIIV